MFTTPQPPTLSGTGNESSPPVVGDGLKACRAMVCLIAAPRVCRCSLGSGCLSRRTSWRTFTSGCQRSGWSSVALDISTCRLSSRRTPPSWDATCAPATLISTTTWIRRVQVRSSRCPDHSCSIHSFACTRVFRVFTYIRLIVWTNYGLTNA